MHIHPSLVASERYSRSAFGFDSQSFTSFRNNLVLSVSHLTAPLGGKMRDPGNEVDFETPSDTDAIFDDTWPVNLEKLDALREKIRESLRWSVTDVKSYLGWLALSTVAKFVSVSIAWSIS